MNDPTLSLDTFLPYRLSFASNRISEHVATAYQEHGLSIPQWRVIAIIAEEDGMTQAAICARGGFDKVTVSRAAIALVQRGLVAREAHARDGRARILRLTNAGRSLHARIAPRLLAMEAALLSGFEPEEVATLAALLGRLGDAVP
ncbi:MarR family winged helix-turn-helix transcriptional regulator [Sphingomonas sp.]|uniref:MarR family winged helix-turn-helix transcriptional regulator n=1 Tax=Sphingomonas sp. TaxID=28214 RepID=UPI003AFF7CF2